MQQMASCQYLDQIESYLDWNWKENKRKYGLLLVLEDRCTSISYYKTGDWQQGGRDGSVKCWQLPFLREDARIENSICKTNGQDLLQIEEIEQKSYDKGLLNYH